MLEMEANSTSEDEKADEAIYEEGHEAVDLHLSGFESEILELTRVPLKVWVTLLISCLAGLMASISSTALLVVFKQILSDLHSTVATMLWVKIVLLLVFGGSVGIVGKLGDVIGQALLYKFGLFVFTIGSLLGGLSSAASKGMDLLASRVVVGFGETFLFINSTAILTTAFAPYNKVGFAQGMFQVSVAVGTLLGPVVGGGLGALRWRWIFFWCVPVGSVCTLLSLWAVEEPREVKKVTLREFLTKFDFIGAIFYPTGLCLIYLAMIQSVQPSPPLDQKNPLIIMITVATVCGIIFLVDQFLAVDPLFPPRLFCKRIFAACNMANTCMGFVRQSISYAFIFYLQGPKHMTSLESGTAFIPFGVGLLVSGFASGTISDFFYPAMLSVSGCLLTIISVVAMLFLDENSKYTEIECILFFSGVGYGLFQSPNTMSLMICVDKNHRGVAAALNYLTQMFTSVLGIVLTYNLIINTMTEEQIIELFILGNKLPPSVMKRYMEALKTNYYVIIGVCTLAMIFCSFNNTPSKKNENEDIRSLYAPSSKVQSNITSRRLPSDDYVASVTRHNNSEEMKEEYDSDDDLEMGNIQH